jgi:cobalt/nickel transport system ATP-binding protein
MTCAIDVNHVYFRYDEFEMHDIKMQLHISEHKAMVGLNGSGKTTLFKLILGLLEPEDGDIYVFDRKVSRENLWEVRRNIGFLFQNPDDQLFAPTVWEDVAFGPRNLGLPEEEIKKRVADALQFVQMSDYINRPVNQMSYGQAKRVAIAGILAMQPKILFLDEPFSGLDFPMIRSIFDVIQRLRREGISVLFTTHNRFFLENWADSVVALKEGRVIFDGPVDTALKNDEVLSQIGDWDSLRRDMKRS